MNQISGVSIVIPVFNEEGNISNLAQEIKRAFIEIEISWECIWVDDGSSDKSWAEISKLDLPNRGISLYRNSGQSTAIMCGIESAKFDIVITLDGDGQNDPGDISKFISRWSEELDLILGYRVDRNDNKMLRVLPSKIANFISRKISGVKIRDLGCTMKMFNRQILQQNRILGEMHRVIGLYLILSGAKYVEIPTSHRARNWGSSKYSLNRTFKFIADILLAKLMFRLTSKPLYFFGLLALLSLVFGILNLSLAFFLFIAKIKSYIDGSLVNASLTFVMLSLILLSIGLLAELVVRVLISIKSHNQYSIKSVYPENL